MTQFFRSAKVAFGAVSPSVINEVGSEELKLKLGRSLIDFRGFAHLTPKENERWELVDRILPNNFLIGLDYTAINQCQQGMLSGSNLGCLGFRWLSEDF